MGSGAARRGDRDVSRDQPVDGAPDPSPRVASPDASREVLLQRLRASSDPWDIIVVGGGATGLGTAVDAASRGFRTLLLEAGDFASGTSSKATKLVHGGVRYLAQGRLSMVREALRERDLLLRNAPHLAWPLGFVIPAYRPTDRLFYGIGLKLYDALAGGRGIGRSRVLSAAETMRSLPNVNRSGLRGGILYFDGQFDDAALALALVHTAAGLGGLLLNYVRVDGFLRPTDHGGKIEGVRATDTETGERFTLRARCVVNATGVWVDALRKADDPGSVAMVAPSQGTHLVLSRAFLPGEHALLVPRTDDGRVLFVVPWLGYTIVGTTDIPRPQATLDAMAPSASGSGTTAVPSPGEVDFLLRTVAPYLSRRPTRADVLSAWAGLRPLVQDADAASNATSGLSREHVIAVSDAGLVTITGGKWTTYRRMAEEVVDTAIAHGLLDQRPCETAVLPIHGSRGSDHDAGGASGGAGSHAVHPGGPAFGLTEQAVRTAVRSDQALTVEDVLARRHRALLLDARSAMALAPMVAAVIGAERGKDQGWVEREVQAFRREAAKFLVDS